MTFKQKQLCWWPSTITLTSPTSLPNGLGDHLIKRLEKGGNKNGVQDHP